MKCRKCEIEKIDSEMVVKHQKIHNLCKECNRKISREYYAKNREKANQKRKQRYYDDREKLLESAKERYQENREKIKTEKKAKNLDAHVKPETIHVQKTEKEFTEQNDLKSLNSEPKPQKITEKPLTQFTDHEQKKSSIKEKLKKEFKTPIEQQDPYEFVPEPSRIISFQDLNLGFDNHYATIGNNANLIQPGITSAVPDAASLKHLTYYNQCAEMMKNEIRTHPQIRLCQNVAGKNLVCAVTVDRQGRQLEFRMLQGSGNVILDRVIQESIMAVKMFPPVPSFIPDSPFVMRWRWYF